MPLPFLWLPALVLLFALSGGGSALADTGRDDLTPLRVQLQWVHQAQFAGLYMARERLHFQQRKLAVTLLPLSPGEDPLASLREGRADIAVTNLNDALRQDVTGPAIVNVAQLFAEGGLNVLCRISQGVIRPADMVGKRIGVWGIGDERMVAAMLGLLDIPASAVELVDQAPDGADLVSGEVDCATAMTYNEQLRIRRAGVPQDDLIILRPEQFGLANVEDGLYVRADRLDDPQFRAQLVAFIHALRLGWHEVRLAPTLAVEAVMRANPELDRAFQLQMLEAVLRLIPEDPAAFGRLDLEDFQRQYRLASAGADTPSADSLWTYRVMNALARQDGVLSAYTPPTLFYVDEFASQLAFKLMVYFGVFAYALTGVLEAINRGYDFWGRLVLAMLSGVGGGTLRDLIIGVQREPYYYVADPTYPSGILLVTLLVSLIVFTFPSLPETRGFRTLKSYSDMIGFCVLATTGAVIAISADMPWFWAPVCAALTCAGGGMLRDIVINREPQTLKGVIYEEVALVGGLFVAAGLFVANSFEHTFLPVWLSVGGGLALMFLLKWLIHHYHWVYPHREATLQKPAPPAEKQQKGEQIGQAETG